MIQHYFLHFLQILLHHSQYTYIYIVLPWDACLVLSSTNHKTHLFLYWFYWGHPTESDYWFKFILQIVRAGRCIGRWEREMAKRGWNLWKKGNLLGIWIHLREMWAEGGEGLKHSKSFIIFYARIITIICKRKSILS